MAFVSEAKSLALRNSGEQGTRADSKTKKRHPAERYIDKVVLPRELQCHVVACIPQSRVSAMTFLGNRTQCGCLPSLLEHLPEHLSMPLRPTRPSRQMNAWTMCAATENALPVCEACSWPTNVINGLCALTFETKRTRCQRRTRRPCFR